MDRAIQPHAAAAHDLAGRGAAPVLSLPADPVKTPSDFMRALRRRFWVVVAVALAVGLPGSVFVVRMPPVYRAVASIVIEPPHFDEGVSVIIPHGGVAPSNQEAIAKYVPNRLAMLRGRGLAEAVAADPALALPPGGDPVQEIVFGVQTRRLPDTNYFDIHLEGNDPERITKLLNGLLDRFAQDARADSRRSLENSIGHARGSLVALRAQLKNLDKEILTTISGRPIFTPDGKNILSERLVMLKSVVESKRLRFDDLQHEQRIAQFYPQIKSGGSSPIERRVSSLLEYKEYLVNQLQAVQRIARDPNNDPAARHWSRLLNKVLDQLEALQRQSFDATGDLATMVMANANEEIARLEKETGILLGKLQESLPDHQKYVGLLREREQKEKSIATMEERLDHFRFLSETQSLPVTIIQRAVEPTVPIRPNRALYIALVGVLGLGLGVGFVCLLEYVDHRIKVPEHLTMGLGLPLLGVVPRISRMARNHLGGHLWTPGAPGSIEADAFRNVRASLLGLSSPQHRPIVTLLVTSAKAGDGKSTTALNLAAACAKSGERTLLVDCDLRRPSLREVFRDEASDHEIGLADVLRDEIPWPRAVIRTHVANLDFMPSGDPSDLPIEILGAIELRQLIKAVAGHYHRVILDGPAVLGMADCRMLGRIVDATVLVVRSGAHALSPLRRAKAMLDQSRVPIAGLVFNGLAEDFDNWSTYGSREALDAMAARDNGQSLEAPAADAATRN
jgi:capsular exopolysaccharide synthesis family protein